MRFFRFMFWVLAVLQAMSALAFVFAPDFIRNFLELGPQMPLTFVQTRGLIMIVITVGLISLAEHPAINLAALLCFIDILLPLFSVVGYYRNELSFSHLNFELGLDLSLLPFLIAYFFWYYHKPRPNRFVPLIGLFGMKK